MPRKIGLLTLGIEFTKDAFKVMQPDFGTSPTADAPDDILTLTSSDGTVDITGDATTDTIDFSVDLSDIVNLVPQNTCYVSPSFVDDPAARRFSTFLAANTYAKTQSPSTGNRWLIHVFPGTYLNDTFDLDTDYIYAIGDSEATSIFATSSAVPTCIISVYNTHISNLTFVQTANAAIANISGPTGSTTNTLMTHCSFVGSDLASQQVNFNAGTQLVGGANSFTHPTCTSAMINQANSATIDVKLGAGYVSGTTTILGGTFRSTNEINTGALILSNACNVVIDGTTYESTGTAGQINTTGSVKLNNTTFISAAGANTVTSSAQPTPFLLNNTAFEYSGAAPSYGFYSASTLTFTTSGLNNAFQKGCSPTITNASTTIRDVKSSGSTYSTVNDAMGAASAGDMVDVGAGTYVLSSALTATPDVTLRGQGRTATSIEFATAPILFPAGMANEAFTCQDVELKVGASAVGLDMSYGVGVNFLRVDITNGSIVCTTKDATNGVDFTLTDSSCAVVNIADAVIASKLTLVLANFQGGSGLSGAAAHAVSSHYMFLTITDTSFAGTLNIVNSSTQTASTVNCNALSIANMTGPVLSFTDSTTGEFGLVSVTNSSFTQIIGGSLVKIDADHGSFFDPVFAKNTFTAGAVGATAYDIEMGTGRSWSPILVGNAQSIGYGTNTTGVIKAKGASVLNVGGGVEYYKSYNAASLAAAAGDTIQFVAGTFTENIELIPDVAVQGAGKTATIIQSTADPVATSNMSGSSCLVKDIGFNVTVSNARILNISAGNGVTFRNCSFGSSTTGYVASDTADNTNNTKYRIEGCDMYEVDINSPTTTKEKWLTFIEVEFTTPESTLASSINIQAESGRFTFNRCDMKSTKLTSMSVNNNNYFIQSCNFVGINSALLEIASDSAGDKAQVTEITNCNFGCFAGTPILLSGEASTTTKTVIKGNSMVHVFGPSINCTSATDWDMILQDNSFPSGFGAGGLKSSSTGAITFLNPIKNYRGDGDFYGDITSALMGCTTDGDTVMINEDLTITSALTPLSNKLNIMSAHDASITRAAGSPIMTLSAGDDVTITNLKLVGSLDVTGNATKLTLRRSRLDGMIDVQSGTAASEITVDASHIEGDATDKYAINIADVDPIITVKNNSYLKGDAGDPAIYYTGVANNNLRIEGSTIMHGSLSTNNPIQQSASSAINYKSHHSTYNEDPESDPNFTNLISAPCDVFDVNGDY